MFVELSSYLQAQRDILKKLVAQLQKDFVYVSVLGVDTSGKSYMVKKTGVDLNDSRWAERGFVVRVYNGVYYAEHSFNELCEAELGQLIQKIRETALGQFEKLQEAGIECTQYPLIQEEPMKESFFSEVGIHPKDVSHKDKLHKLEVIRDKALALSEELIDCRVRYEEVHVSKVFISQKKDLCQSYIWTSGSIVPIASRAGKMKYTLTPISGMKGVEILEELDQHYEKCVEDSIALLGAFRTPQGEFDIICNPDVSGLIAHEAFGHGVEMDMFVKNRAKAVEYMGQPVASTKVDMHDGAKAALEVSSYLFDDEGTIGTDTKIIEKGILKQGISDMLSALTLGTVPTGNGKRESYERKAYTRMTNTFFSGGSDSLEDMIGSIQQGYFLEGFMSGMEDPKNWGIQCVITFAREISEGKLTGKIVAPVYLTGYVPDLLKSVTMVSADISLSGSGACGKGHKELVKTSTGGPYIKTRGRLG
ncbi:MAG: TldD/PmbA family protein [Vallitaleaceae bacterium]|nr:TldD/PmbA family protein [Vallitaleaceae bacterium]